MEKKYNNNITIQIIFLLVISVIIFLLVISAIIEYASDIREKMIYCSDVMEGKYYMNDDVRCIVNSTIYSIGKIEGEYYLMKIGETLLNK
jgi:hypothetical protein